MWCSNPLIVAICLNNSHLKCVPPSVIRKVGDGKKDSHRSQKMRAAVAAVISLVGTQMQIRVNWSTMTKMCLYPVLALDSDIDKNP